MKKILINIIGRLSNEFESEGYKGWDPFDGLNSKLFQSTPFKNSRFLRLAWLQFFKRSPVNLRRLVKVPKQYNPKGLGLILSGYCKLYQSEPSEDYLSTINFLADKILILQSPEYHGSCWGYNFDWQARAFFQPKWTPTVVATTFIGYALLDAYDVTKNPKYLEVARSSCEFVLRDLNRTDGPNGSFAFSYSPEDNTQVYNASFLGARLLSRVYSYTNERDLIDTAKKVIQYCCDNQNSDGSWAYSPKPYHQWIDSFHTGYNLEGLAEYARYSEDHSFDSQLEIGLTYYLKTFFESSGAPKYYSNSLYPIDIHSTSQLLVTLVRTGALRENLQMSKRVLDWTIDYMYDSRKGYFFYQKNKWFKNKINYQRWVQADIFYSISLYLYHTSENE